ncbi:hypothetical protein N7490_008877 [Penicillium lividum]|nr:hypothetical protein N7490_008877 [Penicillium lividum]
MVKAKFTTLLLINAPYFRKGRFRTLGTSKLLSFRDIFPPGPTSIWKVCSKISRKPANCCYLTLKRRLDWPSSINYGMLEIEEGKQGYCKPRVDIF